MIKWIVISILGILILSAMGIDIRKSVNSPVTQSNFEYAKEVTVFVWNKYLEEPAKFLWREVFIRFIWNPIIDIFKDKLGGSGKEEIGVNLERTPFL